ncbi:hypothetical protein [Leisingera sp. ANG-S5]|uniref:hypothetical protein n=1 Tax=Leisingera sp. ANG-S5 TaxID=1577901 RepID=UPI00057FCF6B|nr:hypothetical protein [Leisingera sp. ANG-S5]KIC28892.1 hypothetical protein RA25_20745 [Leisingera sp. ANG-S5]
MSLPSDIFPAQQTPEALEQASSLIQRIELELDEGNSDPPALQNLQQLTGNVSLKAEDYFQISSAMGYDDAAELAFCPTARRIENLQFEDFLRLCEIVLQNTATPQFEYWFEVFCLNANSSNAGDLIFSPPQEWIERLASKGEIASETTRLTFQPTAKQLATEAWKSDAILL